MHVLGNDQVTALAKEHLPPQLFQCLGTSRLWPANATMVQVAEAIFLELFKHLDNRVQTVGYWMVVRSGKDLQAAIADVRGGEQPGRWQIDVRKWWKAYKGTAAWKGRGADGQQQVMADAAKKVFYNPPVTYAGTRLVAACMVVTHKGGRVFFDKEYPVLVLKWKPMVAIHAHQLITWLFQGPPPGVKGNKPHSVRIHDNVEVCVQHRDKPATDLGQLSRDGVEFEQHHLDWRRTPLVSRCLSARCVCPYCVFWGNMPDNTRDGRAKAHTLGKQLKHKYLSPVQQVQLQQQEAAAAATHHALQQLQQLQGG